MTTSSGLKEIYSPKSQIGDYDSSHIRFLLDAAINDATTALTKAQESEGINFG